jgi:hypothetical protein
MDYEHWKHIIHKLISCYFYYYYNNKAREYKTENIYILLFIENIVNTYILHKKSLIYYKK